MPEGNEVHRFAAEHAEWFVDRAVRVEAPNGRFEDGAVLLDRRKLKSVEAFGKHLFYDFGRDHQLHIHLGMYGWFWDGPMPHPPIKGALRLRLSTPEHWVELRGPTACDVLSDQEREAILLRLGPDPLNATSNPKSALTQIASSRMPIALLLMDQAVIAGIGNCYRSELLFRARLHPKRPGRSVPEDTVQKIWREAQTLMRTGMTDGRMVTTLAKDRPHPRGPVRDDETHYVYRRAMKPCFICGTPIEMQEMAARKVYWCPQCQAD
jgi:endonuclease-8